MIWQGLNQMWFCVMVWVIWTNWHWLVMGVLGRLVPTYGSWFFFPKALSPYCINLLIKHLHLAFDFALFIYLF